MIQTQILTAIIALVIGFGSGWSVNGWRMSGQIEARKAEASALLAKSEAQAREVERELNRLTTEAEKLHAEASQRVEAALSHNRRLARQLGGLRDPGRNADCGSALPTDAGSGPAFAAAAAAGLPDEGAGLLSDEAGDFILELAADADRAAAYARACHDWALKVWGGNV